MAERVEVIGLREFQAALTRAYVELPEELERADAEVAELVAREVRRRAPRGVHQGGGRVVSIAASIEATRAGRRAAVSIGGEATPHAQVTEFGGTIPRHGTTARTTVRQQAYLYPGIYASRPAAVEIYDRHIGKLIDPAFPS